MIPRIFYLTTILITIPILSSGSSNEADVVPVVIDSDGGGDDAWGILLFLWNEANARNGNWAYSGITPNASAANMRLEAVTTVTGNTGVQNASRNIGAILEVAGRIDIPVYSGTRADIMGLHEFDNFYGDDGFGDFLKPLKPEIKENEAIDRLVELSKKYEGSLVLICLGPLTNIALAQRRDPQFLSRVREIHMMGGTVYGYGNVKPGVEFNIYHDPESVDIVFRESPNTITVMPYDPVYINRIPLSWRENVLGKLNSTWVNFLNKAERKALTKLPFWSAADPQAVATALWPQLITKSLLTHAVIETGGVHARGAMLIEHDAEPTRSVRNVHMIQEININYYQQLLLLAFKD